MKEHPIIFSGEMVRAILDGLKTQTRRVIRPQPPEPHTVKTSSAGLVVFDHRKMQCPYGLQGGSLWVRESFAIVGNDKEVWYRERDEKGDHCTPAWKPSIHMPRWASRITLEIVGVHVERLREITENGAIAEGVTTEMAARPNDISWSYQRAFAALWDSLNVKRGYGWDVNPWVWVIEFKRLT